MRGKGSLRTFLGTAPGVGKTFAMLAEGRRRAGHGERVVAGWIEWHGRPDTRGQLGGLELIAPRRVAYRGTVFTDFDPGAAIASGAGVVLVDELAHTTADRTRQRWQDVADVAVFGVPDDEWGESVAAVVQPEAGVAPGPELSASILASLEGRLARMKWPKRIEFIAEMPRDPTGKLLKRRLREPYWQGRDTAI